MRFRILGPLTVEHNGAPVEVTAPKQRALLILLLLEAGHVVPAEVILDRLWQENLPSGGLKTVRFHVSSLRTTLEPEVRGSGWSVVQTRDSGYFIDPTLHEIDARRFDRLATEGHRDVETRPDRAHRLLTDALSLWRGMALHDVAYEDFAVAEARRLEARKLTAAEDLMATELRLGRTAGMVAELEELVAANPLRERTTELLMQALYGAGRSADAIAAAQNLRRELGELGLDPPPSLVQLEEQILVHDQSLAAPSVPKVQHDVRPLPARLTSFIGRRAEIRYVRQALDEKRLVTLVGAPGSGKTRLALESGRLLVDEFADGVAWVELADIAGPGLVPQAVVAGLGIAPPLGADYAELVITHLRSRTALLVIDNCEHVLADAARLIVSILENCPDVKVLASSREALGVPGELSWTIPPFELPPRIRTTLDNLVRVDSMQLFIDRAKDADSRFELGEHNATAVAAICRRLDGLPLAIELAASATEALTAGQILTRLDRRFVDVPGARRHGATRQTTMEEAVRWSHELLDPTDAAVFTRLSVFSGGFTMEAAEAVAGWGALASDDVFDSVLRLVHKSLLVPMRSENDQVRYKMLTVLRQFGGRELRATGESDTVDERHAAYYADVAESIAPHIEGPTASRARIVADLELDNFRVAMESSLVNGRTDVALRIDAALTWHWYWRSLIQEGLKWGLRILEASPNGEPSEARAQVLYAVGIFQTITRPLAEGNVSFEAASAMAQALGLEALHARTLTGRGVNARDRGRLSAALEYLSDAAAIDRRIGDMPHLALTLRFVGIVRFMLGDLNASVGGTRRDLRDVCQGRTSRRHGLGHGGQGSSRIPQRDRRRSFAGGGGGSPLRRRSRSSQPGMAADPHRRRQAQCEKSRRCRNRLRRRARPFCRPQ